MWSTLYCLLCSKFMWDLVATVSLRELPSDYMNKNNSNNTAPEVTHYKWVFFSTIEIALFAGINLDTHLEYFYLPSFVVFLEISCAPFCNRKGHSFLCCLSELTHLTHHDRLLHLFTQKHCSRLPKMEL